MDNSIKKETLYLYIIQISNFLIPLITLPYLTRVLGLEGFGKLGFAQTIFFLFIFILDFGFNLSGAKNISVNKDSKKNIDTIYSNIQFIKFVIYFLLFFLAFPFFIINGGIDGFLILIAYFSSFGSLLIGNFVFNGLGINSKLALITVLVKSLFIIPVFLFVKTKDDILMAVIFQTLPTIIIGVIVQVLFYRFEIVKFKFKYIKHESYLLELRQGYNNFIASFFTLGFTYLTPIIIKFSIGDAALGVYTVVDRLMTALKQLYSPIIQSFFSKICIFYENDITKYLTLLKKVIVIFLFIGLSAFFGVLILGNFLLPIILGGDYNIYLYLLMAIIVQIIVSFSSVLVNFVIIPSDNSYFLKIVYFTATLVYFPVFFVAIKLLKLNGVFISMIFIELFILSFLFLFIKSKKMTHFS